MKRISRFKGLAHLCIYTVDMDKSLDFYTDLLQFKVEYETILQNQEGPLKYVLIRQESLIIELLQPFTTENVKQNVKGSIDHFAIEVENIEAIVDDLKNKGVIFSTDLFVIDNLFKGIKGAFILGPSGESIELFEYTK